MGWICILLGHEYPLEVKAKVKRKCWLRLGAACIGAINLRVDELVLAEMFLSGFCKQQKQVFCTGGESKSEEKMLAALRNNLHLCHQSLIR